jgi:hypothetical protein
MVVMAIAKPFVKLVTPGSISVIFLVTNLQVMKELKSKWVLDSTIDTGLEPSDARSKLVIYFSIFMDDENLFNAILSAADSCTVGSGEPLRRRLPVRISGKLFQKGGWR